MPIYFWDGKPLFVNGSIATHENCCCVDCCAICKELLLLIYNDTTFEFTNQFAVWSVSETQTISLHTHWDSACVECEASPGGTVWAFAVEGVMYYVCNEIDATSVLWDLSWHGAVGNINCWVSTTTPVTTGSTNYLSLKCGGPPESEAKNCEQFTFKAPEITPVEINCEPLRIWTAVYDCDTETWTITDIGEAAPGSEPTEWEEQGSPCEHQRIWDSTIPDDPDTPTCYYLWLSTATKGADPPDWTTPVIHDSACEDIFVYGEEWEITTGELSCTAYKVTTSKLPVPAPPTIPCVNTYLWTATYDCALETWELVPSVAPVEEEPSETWTVDPLDPGVFTRVWYIDQPDPPAPPICYHHWNASSDWEGAWTVTFSHTAYENEWLPEVGTNAGWECESSAEEGCSCKQVITSLGTPMAPEHECTGVYLWTASHTCYPTCAWVLLRGENPLPEGNEPDIGWTHDIDCFYYMKWGYAPPPDPSPDMYFKWVAIASKGGAEWAETGGAECFCETNPHPELGIGIWNIEEGIDNCVATQITTTCIMPALPTEPCGDTCEVCLGAALPGPEVWELSTPSLLTFTNDEASCEACSEADGYIKITIGGTTYYQCANSIEELNITLIAAVTNEELGCVWIGDYTYSYALKEGWWAVKTIDPNALCGNVAVGLLDLGEVWTACEEEILYHWEATYSCAGCGWTVTQGAEATEATEPTAWEVSLLDACTFSKIDYAGASSPPVATPTCYQTWIATATWGSVWTVDLSHEECFPPEFDKPAWECSDPDGSVTPNCFCILNTSTTGCWEGPPPAGPTGNCDACDLCDEPLQEDLIDWHVSANLYSTHEDACTTCQDNPYTKFTFKGVVYFVCEEGDAMFHADYYVGYYWDCIWTGDYTLGDAQSYWVSTSTWTFEQCQSVASSFIPAVSDKTLESCDVLYEIVCAVKASAFEVEGDVITYTALDVGTTECRESGEAPEGSVVGADCFCEIQRTVSYQWGNTNLTPPAITSVTIVCTHIVEEDPGENCLTFCSNNQPTLPGTCTSTHGDEWFWVATEYACPVYGNPGSWMYLVIDWFTDESQFPVGVPVGSWHSFYNGWFEGIFKNAYATSDLPPITGEVICYYDWFADLISDCGFWSVWVGHPGNTDLILDPPYNQWVCFSPHTGRMQYIVEQIGNPPTTEPSQPSPSGCSTCCDYNLLTLGLDDADWTIDIGSSDLYDTFQAACIACGDDAAVEITDPSTGTNYFACQGEYYLTAYRVDGLGCQYTTLTPVKTGVSGVVSVFASGASISCQCINQVAPSGNPVEIVCRFEYAVTWNCETKTWGTLQYTNITKDTPAIAPWTYFGNGEYKTITNSSTPPEFPDTPADICRYEWRATYSCTQEVWIVAASYEATYYDIATTDWVNGVIITNSDVQPAAPTTPMTCLYRWEATYDCELEEWNLTFMGLVPEQATEGWVCEEGETDCVCYHVDTVSDEPAAPDYSCVACYNLYHAVYDCELEEWSISLIPEGPTAILSEWNCEDDGEGNCECWVTTNKHDPAPAVPAEGCASCWVEWEATKTFTGSVWNKSITGVAPVGTTEATAWVCSTEVDACKCTKIDRPETPPADPTAGCMVVWKATYHYSTLSWEIVVDGPSTELAPTAWSCTKVLEGESWICSCVKDDYLLASPEDPTYNCN